MSSKADDRQPEQDQSDPFEASAFFVRRRATGAEFSLSRLSLDLASHYFTYKNPAFGLNIDFDALLIVERLETRRDGVIPQVEACTGALLIAGDVRNKIQIELLEKPEMKDVGQFVADCHKLICEYIRRCAFRYFEIEVIPHLYEADEEWFWPYLKSLKTRVGPEAIKESSAVRIL